MVMFLYCVYKRKFSLLLKDELLVRREQWKKRINQLCVFQRDAPLMSGCCVGAVYSFKKITNYPRFTDPLIEARTGNELIKNTGYQFN